MQLGGPPGYLWTFPSAIYEDAMTAIGAAGVTGGYVIAADGRKRLDDESRAQATDTDLEVESDETQKIFPIRDTNRVLAFAVSGFIRLSGFDLLQGIHRQVAALSSRHFDSALKYLTGLSHNLALELNDAKIAGNIIKLPTLLRTEDDSAWKLLQIVVVGYCNNVGSFTICTLSHSNDDEIENHVNVYPKRFAILLGSEVARKAMYPDPGGTKDKRFSQYTTPLPLMSLAHAEAYVKGYVAACCSDLANELDPSMSPTGGHIHVARITPQLGFQWAIPPKFGPVTASTT